MPKLYSSDYRRCVLENYDRGMSRSAILETFNIGQRTLYNWLRNRSSSYNSRGEYKKVRKISKSALLEYVETHNDFTLLELSEKFSCSQVAIWKRLKSLGITRKKNDSISGKKPQKA